MTPADNDVHLKVVGIVSAITRQRLDGDAEVSRRTVDAWDSLAHVEILFTVEETFAVEFDDEAMRRMDSAESITAEVKRLGGAHE